MTTNRTRSGVRRAGDDYQDIVALDVLVDWLEHPDRYKSVRLEANDAGALDDVVASQHDGKLIAKQVKFSAHPEDADDPYTWDQLLTEPLSKRGTPLRSLLGKWFDSVRTLQQQSSDVHACLISNRRPADELRSAFGPTPDTVDFDRVTDQNVRAALLDQLGTEAKIRAFFGIFAFQLDHPGLDVLEQAVLRRFRSLGLSDHGWINLKDQLRRWIRENSEISFTAVQGASLWEDLEALPQEFVVPPDFIVPSRPFHDRVRNKLKTLRSGCIVLSGPPGIGKTTYISNLYRELRADGLFVIRHHYYLSQDDNTAFRYEHERVARSLMAEIRDEAVAAGLHVPNRNPQSEHLSAWLKYLGDQLTARGATLIVILDGLDHVWAEEKSIAELDRLFQLLTPIQNGVVIVVGTQPVDPGRLPTRLADVAPRSTWWELPALEYTAVREWTTIHADELIGPPNGGFEHRLDEISFALWRKSEGYPLHLRYILGDLREQHGIVTERAIEALPDVPHKDIREYYEHLWNDLPDDSRQVLCLLSTCEFPWSRTAISDCLDPLKTNLAIDSAIRKVYHLTVEGPLGLTFVHRSIREFVRGHADYTNYAQRIRDLTIAWLKTKAPVLFKWSYEWLIEADSGDDSPLISGPSRDWLVEGMAHCYPAYAADRILTGAAKAALSHGDIGRFTEIALLSDYLSGATDFREEIVDRLTFAQLAAGEDPLLVARLGGDLRTLGSTELEALAEYSYQTGTREIVDLCFDQLNKRLQLGNAIRTGRDERMVAARCLIRIAAFTSMATPSASVDFIKQWQGDPARTLWRDYLQSLRTHRNIDALRTLGTLPLEPIGDRADVLTCLAVSASEEQAELGISLDSESRSLPMIVLYRILYGDNGTPSGAIDLEPPWVLDLKWRDYFGRHDEVDTFLYSTFFAFTSNHLLNHAKRNQTFIEEIQGRGWGGGFLERMEAVSREIATNLASRTPTTYQWFIDQFSRLSPPHPEIDRDGHRFSIAARKAIFRVAVDLLSMQAPLRPPSLDAADVVSIRSSTFFSLEPWLDSVVPLRRRWFTKEGLDVALELVRVNLDSTIDTFDARAEVCLHAAELAASNGASDLTAHWVRQCWDNLLSYGYHKDMLFDQCLGAIRHLIAVDVKSESASLLRRLAPAIATVGEYTDGDHTRHFPAELGEILVSLDIAIFAKYYDWLGRRDDYWESDTILTFLLKTVDLSNPAARAVAETAIEPACIATLADRAKEDSNALECLTALLPFNPPAERAPSESGASSSGSLHDTGSLQSPEAFPPERFVDFLEAVKQSKTYRVDESVEEWARVWAEKGFKKEVLQILETYDENGMGLFRNNRLRFDLALAVYGKERAFRWLIAGQRSSYGWNEYYSRKEDVQYTWEQVRKYYPGRWLEFLQETLMDDPGRVFRSGVTMHSYISRVVEYLIFVGQVDTAKKVAAMAVQTALSLVPLALPQPDWTSVVEAA